MCGLLCVGRADGAPWRAVVYNPPTVGTFSFLVDWKLEFFVEPISWDSAAGHDRSSLRHLLSAAAGHSKKILFISVLHCAAAFHCE